MGNGVIQIICTNHYLYVLYVLLLSLFSIFVSLSIPLQKTRKSPASRTLAPERGHFSGHTSLARSAHPPGGFLFHRTDFPMKQKNGFLRRLKSSAGEPSTPHKRLYFPLLHNITVFPFIPHILPDYSSASSRNHGTCPLNRVPPSSPAHVLPLPDRRSTEVHRPLSSA